MRLYEAFTVPITSCEGKGVPGTRNQLKLVLGSSIVGIKVTLLTVYLSMLFDVPLVAISECTVSLLSVFRNVKRVSQY